MRMLTKIAHQSTLDVITAGLCLGLLVAFATKPLADLGPSETLLVSGGCGHASCGGRR